MDDEEEDDHEKRDKGRWKKKSRILICVERTL